MGTDMLNKRLHEMFHEGVGSGANRALNILLCVKSGDMELNEAVKRLEFIRDTHWSMGIPEANRQKE